MVFAKNKVIGESVQECVKEDKNGQIGDKCIGAKAIVVLCWENEALKRAEERAEDLIFLER